MADAEIVVTTTAGNDISGFENLQVDSNFTILLFSLISAMVWIIYVTYYNSRVVGYIVTRLLSKFFVTRGQLKIGMI